MSTPAQTVLAYHQRTKHRLERYAAGPETLDWSLQPDPFRSFAGAPRLPLPFTADELATSYSQLGVPAAVAPHPPGLKAIAALLELSLGLSAWKEYGPDRWALRCNPSSGNLHPTETYVLSRGTPVLADGVYHYLSREHCLEQRLALPPSQPAGLYLALSSVHWREAWKYGERAFRYCQLDTGHALGALRYAAAALGWSVSLVAGQNPVMLTGWLGLDRAEDYAAVEGEEPELLLAIHPALAGEPPAWASSLAPAAPWTGRPNRLDPHPMYRWPVIDEVAAASRQPAASPDTQPLPAYPAREETCTEAAVDIIRRRRSAQAFDARGSMGREAFFRLLDALLPRRAVPWDVWAYAPRLHPVFFVHRVAGLEPGLYALPRSPQGEHELRGALSPDFLWQKVDAAPSHIPLYLLQAGDGRKAARTLCCHQAIAADSCFALGMLAEFGSLVPAHAWRYRQLHWEAGLLGHALYLQAEAAGLRGTGIGCYFDDAFHELLGLSDDRLQSLYHFTVGVPLADTRITTLPPYAEQDKRERRAMSADPQFHRMDKQGAAALLQDRDTLIFDVRAAADYRDGHLAGAVHLSMDNAAPYLVRTHKDRPILIYCYRGNSSQVYAQMFADFGFRKVYSLDEGYNGWIAAQQSQPAPVDAELAAWLAGQGYGPDINAAGPHGMTPLMRACRLGDAAIVRVLLDAGAGLHTRNIDGNQALWPACVGENLEVLDLLIRAGADLNHQNDTGASCLMYAASTGKFDVLQYLLAAGADPGLSNQDEFTALDMVATEPCLRLLRPEQKAPRDHRQTDGPAHPAQEKKVV